MRDFDELVANLRNCAKVNSLSLYKRDLMKQAADAIEELFVTCRAQKAAFDAYMDKMPKWVSVEERLPIKGDRVICFGDNGINLADFVCGDKWCALPWFYLDGEQETGVTHWIPLPESPKEE